MGTAGGFRGVFGRSSVPKVSQSRLSFSFRAPLSSPIVVFPHLIDFVRPRKTQAYQRGRGVFLKRGGAGEDKLGQSQREYIYTDVFLLTVHMSICTHRFYMFTLDRHTRHPRSMMNMACYYHGSVGLN